MKTLSRRLAIFCFALFLSYIAIAAELPKRALLEGGFSVEIPLGVILKQRDVQKDFSVYDFTDNSGIRILTVYFGSAPDLGKLSEANAEHKMINSISAALWLRKSATGIRGDYLFHLNPKEDLTAHFFFTLPEDQVSIATKIVESFKNGASMLK